ncbi:flagellar hook-basal body protein [Desulfoscipio sp. XC116]|uniref:flagellar hook-basal body protein n=1 Tax=Desulfoscipio sp. XC116 TaxID=3144975 RepID=UPI00325C07E7
MIRGIYSTVSGMNLQMTRAETASRNLDNINLPGYKKDRIEAEPFLRLVQLSAGMMDNSTHQYKRSALGITNQGAEVQELSTDFSVGDPRETGNKTDFALQGPGFFTLSDPENEANIYYTRNGSFHLDQAGYLVNANGLRVMGEGGPVQLEGPDSFEVDANGNITENGTLNDSISIVTFENLDNLVGVGNNLYQAPDQGTQPVENPGLNQGFLEAANVESADEMTNLVTAVRAYETGQKIIQTQDNMLDMAINKVGTIR